MQRVLITGAAGFIGSHLCEALLADGVVVAGIDCFAPHYPRECKELNLASLLGRDGFSLIAEDLLDAPLAELLDGIDVVFHLAARPGVRESWADFPDYLHNNVAATKALLDACAARAVRLVFASSSSIYGDRPELPVAEDAPPRPISPYGATKAMTEMMVGAYAAGLGLDAVGLRYFTVYGPRQRPDMGLARFIEAADAGEAVSVYGDGRQLRDFTYIGDAVEATIAAARRGSPGSIYNVASSRPVALIELLGDLGEVLGHRLELVHEQPRLGDVRDTWADTRRAREALGFAAQTTLADGLAAQVREARSRRSALAVD